MCTVNIRGHEANFYEAEAMRPRSRPNDLSSRPHGPQGINILRDGSRLVLGTERVQGQKLYRQMNEHFSTFYAINNNTATI